MDVLEEIFDIDPSIDPHARPNEYSENEDPGVSTNPCTSLGTSTSINTNSGVNQGDQALNLQQGTSIEDGADLESDYQYNLAEKRNFIEVINSDGSISNIRKSTFVWKLLENNGKLSNDRLKRVRGASNSLEPHQKKQKKSNASTSKESDNEILFKSTDIQVGDWALFKMTDESEIQAEINHQNSKQFLEENCLFGHILGFKTIGQKGKMIQYKYRYAKTPFSQDYKVQASVQVLAAWYTCNESGTLIPVENKKKIDIHMQNYISTMKTIITTKVSDISAGNWKLSYEIPCEFSEISTLILNHL